MSNMIVDKVCTVLPCASAPCCGCGERVWEDLHVSQPEGCGSTLLYCSGCCPECQVVRA